MLQFRSVSLQPIQQIFVLFYLPLQLSDFLLDIIVFAGQNTVIIVDLVDDFTQTVHVLLDELLLLRIDLQQFLLLVHLAAFLLLLVLVLQLDKLSIETLLLIVKLNCQFLLFMD